MGNSIRFRLWSAAAISIAIALAIAGVGLRYLFELNVERRVVSELTVDLNELIGATKFASDGRLSVESTLADQRFASPLSGHYWQVEDLATHSLVRSRSLWDATLTLPERAASGELRTEELKRPGDELTVAVVRTITDADGRAFRAIVAEDHSNVEVSVGEYVRDLAPALMVLAFALMGAFFIQITVGLAPLEGLRVAVRDVIAQRTARLDVAAPGEVQPLADEINRLLDAQEKALSRARSRATDLAHGLKTPLQVLSADIRTLREKGETKLADEIEKSAGAIRRHVERELARARLAPGVSGRAACRVREVAAGVVAVVKRTPRGKQLSFLIDAAEDFMAPIDEGDLSEILGNLVENATRFAKSFVRVGACANAGEVVLAVVDDGPGIPEADRQAVLSRGVQLDSKGGSRGLGLAIVSDIVEAYGGRLTMANASPGLAVTIYLPRHG
ncbi:HAMP domain-containing histidine kinase [Mesorhizobium sp. M1C.F.Ca.ET.193.01.1.1]|uniref:sensor histidine kinase n=1 Tax=unclassified Mesorhizobium TaxID=325217 RepID=UPI000FD2A2B2|nr:MULTISPECIES: HAMP domain-containing sensor histidine kinase [unclassified Mesorhizobium]TGS99060.1 HAMP domain-containing histidine kinase [bacterium M00.F.Ca.ET.177.01.1.1]TGQ53098.1 HAMP domain-containing histidine kinase [Mesorhizobium sp. M1C.F.Ca.ET.210.01.1.1]TGQ70375.1 HAMP domain-containing histidine kinase [Mesorhizobium sp. M1C.F.Ca.ET.212.01.1.1]TGR06706.1 HAMP domain-containing histidine kinase [Mesorhizobium sp. M1C.F.Ca.ET.204.01.1.1]TGR27229.1 HAMP domain-containing histidin